MTPENLQDAVVADLKGLFAHHKLKNSLGTERVVEIYANDTPVRQGDDDGVDCDAPPEPYIVVKLMGGNIQDETAPHVMDIVLVACVYDRDPNRQGSRDALHLVNEIYHHYATGGVVARRYTMQYPIRWVVADENTHPYYYAAVALNFEAKAVTKEVPEV